MKTSTYKDIKIIAFVGLPGVGKSSAVDYLTSKGYPKVYFGGVVLQALKDAQMDDTPANEKYMREKLRADEGNGCHSKPYYLANSWSYQSRTAPLSLMGYIAGQSIKS